MLINQPTSSNQFYHCAVKKFLVTVHSMECNKEVVAAVIKKCQLSQHMLDLGDHVILAVIPTLLQLMTKGLGERVELVQVQPHSPPEVGVITLITLCV